VRSQDSSTFDTTIKAWLQAMNKAKKLKPGGRLVFVNKKTGSAVPMAGAGTNQDVQ